MKLLKAETNRYRGCWVNGDLPQDPEMFKTTLIHSLSVWQQEGIKVVWLTIPLWQSALIPIAASQGFIFHHVSHESGVSLVLTKQLVEGAMIPEFANHTMGVGGIVFNDKHQVLAVVESHDQVKRPGHWKFPGGAVDRGELLRDAVIREVYEETGINARFNGIVGFRHYHLGQFGTSNCYFLCHLTAENHVITPCPNEIARATWFDIDDYLATDTVLDFNKTMLKAALNEQYLTSIELQMLVNLDPADYEIYLSRH